MANDKSEKPTPKKLADARKKGQVAKSIDANGAVVLLASLMALSAFGPFVVEQARNEMTHAFALIATPDVVSVAGLSAIAGGALQAAIMGTAPVAIACLIAGVAISLVQVGWKPSWEAIKPEPKKLDPVTGAKNVFGMNALVETAKGIVKIVIVGAAAASVVLPRMEDLLSLTGASPAVIASTLVGTVLAIAQRAGIAYLVVAAADYAWQRRRHTKQLMMDPHEVKEEHKQNQLPPEVRGALRRRQMAAAQARMMAAVPEADVVVTNPTHFAVALKYDGASAAPEVVAKGQDLVARRIREIAEEHGVPVVSDPPLARGLHATVDVGRLIPEELYHAVAQVLAYVYRTAARRRAAA